VKNFFTASNLDVRHDFSKIVALLMTHKVDFFIYEALISLLVSRISWSVITTKTRFKNYIYFNKEGVTSIAANIFLKEKYIVVHAYSQFVGGPYQVSSNNSDYDNRHVVYSFLNPNYYYLNNQAMVDSMKLHYQDTVHHKNIGNIFSEKIKEIKSNSEYIKDVKLQHNIQNQQKVVSIFDTSYADMSKIFANYDEAQYFLKDVIRLAKSMPDYSFLFKPSKGNSFFFEGYWASEKWTDIKQLRHKFDQLSNTFMLSDSGDVVDVISISDVVITNSFSSPTTDALLAGVPAFWYQAKTDVSFSVYNKIPGLVVNGYEDLKAQVNEMLQDDYSMDILDNPDFISLNGDSREMALTSLRLELSNA
jgi:polysaccharide biosynthesis PFTS motif protein